jgi:hypothetical protein
MEETYHFCGIQIYPSRVTVVPGLLINVLCQYIEHHVFKHILEVCPLLEI